jgi:hypothetical protein
MAKTDNPLKQLVTAFIGEFASWLLGTEVREAVPRPTALPTSPAEIQPDLVVHTTLADGRAIVLHIEFQGRTSHKPMPLRMLEYRVRLVDVYRDTPIYSVVFYVGQGAGTHDTGQHQMHAPDGRVNLAWQYEVIRLWEMDAEQVLAMGRPALLALVGQTRITQPEVVLPQVIDTFKTVPDREQQYRLFNAFVDLMGDEELLTMVEKMLENEELLIDTPFLRRMQREREQTMRQNILEILQMRFSLTAEHGQQIKAVLEQMTGEPRLHALFQAAVQLERLAAFQAVLDEQRQQQAGEQSDNENGAA